MSRLPPPDPIEALIAELARLPGLGRRNARRAALRMLEDPQRRIAPLAEALQRAAAAVGPCSRCGNLDSSNPCRICTDPARQAGVICVVEGVADLWALERAHAHEGHYHVLGGLLSALGGVGPEDLRIAGLLERIAEGGVEEVILALPATVDGQATAHVLAERLAPTGVAITRPAQGVPVGGTFDVLDEGTLATALRGRRAL
ncbi:MAG: recombination mediator RecR [Rhodovarius sp.]|nr:recombination mediator RecR [Rhodovarius sp.]MDW8315807.1 recombination mediator RecR [Rhodovarius sp.]